MTIEAIIWDLGGVLVRTENPRPRDQLAARLGISRQEINELVFGPRDNPSAQLGKSSDEEHWEIIRASLDVSQDEIITIQDEFFAGDILDASLIEFIRELKHEYLIGLLSNALPNMRSLLTDLWNIEDVFDQIVISAEIGIMKPDARMFELILEKMEVDPNQAVFIDDLIDNVEGAKVVGMHAIHFRDPKKARTDLEALLEDTQLE